MQIAPLYTAAEVEARISELSGRLYRDYADSPLSVLCIAEGATRFAEALVKRLEERGARLELHTVRARRSQGMQLGAVQVEDFDPAALEDRDVLVVDDVIDEGATLRAVLDLVALVEPRSVRTAVLVDKRGERREPIDLHYVGFEVERGWVVGFGMDVNGEFRDLDEIAVVLDHDEASSRNRR